MRKTLLALATFAALTGTAKAQQFTIYGLEGFVLNPMGAPFWVQPYWSTIGAGFQDGLYENETVKILLPKSTPNGEFSTPTAASVTSLSSSVIPSTGTPYSSFGVWRQTITSLQQNFGLYSAGTVVPPDANWENEFAYTYVGKAWGVYQLGYQFYSSEGTVTINVQGAAHLLFTSRSSFLRTSRVRRSVSSVGLQPTPRASTSSVRATHPGSAKSRSKTSTTKPQRSWST